MQRSTSLTSTSRFWDERREGESETEGESKERKMGAGGVFVCGARATLWQGKFVFVVCVLLCR